MPPVTMTLGLAARPLISARAGLVERVLLGTLLGASLVVRLVGIWHGLPQVYNADEEQHFVPHAAAAADGHLDPDYLENPAALTYLLALVLRIVFIGHSVSELVTSDPTAVFLVSRVVVALLGTLLVFLVYVAGRRIFSGTAGLVAGAIVGFAFLPVFYSHQALNDVPIMVAITLTLLASLKAYEAGGTRAFVLAGCAVGLATATKYNAAPAALLVLAAWLLRLREHPDEQAGWRHGCRVLVRAGAAALGVFALLNPFFIVHIGSGLWQILHEGDQAGDAKLGQSGSPFTYYPVSLLWGLGVVPVVLAVVGAVAGLRGHGSRVRTLLVLIFPALLFLYVCTQGRFFGRWMMPAYPALAILAGHGATVAVDWIRRRLPSRAGVAVWPVIVLVLLAQPVFDSVRSDLLLTRTDTRTEALTWLREHTRPGDRIVVEPALPDAYLRGTGLQPLPIPRPYQDFEGELRPALLDRYRGYGYCWVLVDSHQHDRGIAAGLPRAKAYYRRLDREAGTTKVFSPYRPGATPPPFSYDFSFDYYPLAFARPGPYVEVVRLADCADD